MPGPSRAPHERGFTIHFAADFADKAPRLVRELENPDFLKRLESAGGPRELEQFGVTITGDNDVPVEDIKDHDALVSELRKFKPQTRNPRALGWCKLAAIAAAANEATRPENEM